MHFFQRTIEISIHNWAFSVIVYYPTIIFFVLYLIFKRAGLVEKGSKTVISFMIFGLQISFIIEPSYYLFSWIIVLLLINVKIRPYSSLFWVCFLCCLTLKVKIKICKVLHILRYLTLKYRVTPSKHTSITPYFVLSLHYISRLFSNQHIMIRWFRVESASETITVISQLITSLDLSMWFRGNGNRLPRYGDMSYQHLFYLSLKYPKSTK